MEEEGEDDFDPFTDESALAPNRISVFARVRPSVCARSTVLAVKAADMNSSNASLRFPTSSCAPLSGVLHPWSC